MSVNPGQQIDCNVSHTRKVKPLAQAWQFLLAHGKSLGERFGVPPDELVLSMYSQKELSSGTDAT
jgi:hypothetical protein